jgi:hypothetical protein
MLHARRTSASSASATEALTLFRFSVAQSPLTSDEERAGHPPRLGAGAAPLHVGIPYPEDSASIMHASRRHDADGATPPTMLRRSHGRCAIGGADGEGEELG